MNVVNEVLCDSYHEAVEDLGIAAALAGAISFQSITTTQPIQ